MYLDISQNLPSLPDAVIITFRVIVSIGRIQPGLAALGAQHAVVVCLALQRGSKQRVGSAQREAESTARRLNLFDLQTVNK